jgi:hypothetical protein
VAKLELNITKRDKFKSFAFLFTLAMLTYLLLRAFITEFISDETATYWYFIHRGAFWGENTVWDAANHPLNSFLGHWIHKFTGDVIGWVRIFSVVSFLIYAWASYKLCKNFTKQSLRYLSFVALNSIPYFMEYFAYTRGYGLSMGFYLVGIYHFIAFCKDKSTLRLLYVYLFSFLSFAANLTTVNSVILIIGGVLLVQLTYIKTFTIRKQIEFFVLLGLLVLAMLPLIEFALKLKEAGALYYSSLDGIWDMTGKTLSRYVLFLDQDILMYFYLFLFLVMISLSLKSLFILKWKKWLEERETSLMLLFFGNIAAAIALAVVLKVHYPEDRTGMYFIPLFLLLLFQLMDKIKYSEFALLFFPITFLCNISLHSSVFTPEERITRDFFKKTDHFIASDNTVVVYKTMFANWHFLSSKLDRKTSVPQTGMDKTGYADIFISKDETQADPNTRNPYLKKYYRIIAHESASNHTAYKRKLPAPATLKLISKPISFSMDGEFMNIYVCDTLQKITHAKTLKVTVEGNLSINDTKNSTDLVLVTSNPVTGTERYACYVFELAFQEQKVNTHFKHNFLLENFTDKETEIKVYFWNRKTGIKHEVKDAKVTIFELKLE